MKKLFGMVLAGTGSLTALFLIFSMMLGGIPTMILLDATPLGKPLGIGEEGRISEPIDGAAVNGIILICVIAQAVPAAYLLNKPETTK